MWRFSGSIYGLFATSVYCTLYMFDSNEPTGMVNEQLDSAVLSTVPKSQGDPKIVKRGPKGDPIFGKKGT